MTSIDKQKGGLEFLFLSYHSYTDYLSLSFVVEQIDYIDLKVTEQSLKSADILSGA